MALNKYGIGLEQVRSVLNSANANIPKGHFSDGMRHVGSRRERSDVQGRGIRPLIVAYATAPPVRLSDVARGQSIPSRIFATWDWPTASPRC